MHPKGEHGAKYGLVSVDASLPVGPWFMSDGMNEAGFTISVHTLRESVYQRPSVFEKNMLDIDLIPDLLRNCASVEEGLRYLEDRRVVGPSSMGLGGHWALADAGGRSVVLEYLRGERVVWENTPRVMTNDPPLDWHWRNLNNFANLDYTWPAQNEFLSVETDVGTVPRPTGHGLNLGALPGDGSPPSRYVQLFYLRGYAVKTAPPKTMDDAIVLGSGLLNKVFIPYGTFAPGVTVAERLQGPAYTPFGMIKIPSERRILVRGYRNLRWRQVDLRKIDLTKSMTWPVEDGTLGVEDLSSQIGGSQDAPLNV